MTKDEKLRMYRNMLRIRKFEEHVKECFLKKTIPGATHLYIGQEASAVGVCENLRKDDYITSTHRGHGHCIAKGGRLDLMMAELFGKKTGYCKGKGGSMHIADFDIGILGANGIVGGGLPIATGAGYAIKLRGGDQVSVPFFGDGASNEGSFHESINLAAVLKLPVIFVCENNEYAVSTQAKYSCSLHGVANRAAGYGIAGIQVDGNDVIAVYNAAKELIDKARKGQGPAILETLTYRVEGHYVGDSCKYRDPAETAEVVKKRDPIKNFKKFLLKDGIDEKILTEIEKEATKEVEAADKFAQESPEPELDSVLEDVYV